MIKTKISKEHTVCDIKTERGPEGGSSGWGREAEENQRECQNEAQYFIG